MDEYIDGLGGPFHFVCVPGSFAFLLMEEKPQVKGEYLLFATSKDLTQVSVTREGKEELWVQTEERVLGESRTCARSLPRKMEKRYRRQHRLTKAALL